MNKELDTKTCLLQCLFLIEEKLGWGSSDEWQGQEFENLAEHIFEVSGVQLSVTTLKRVWGKVQYSSLPSASTKNALAVFLGYENWTFFRLALQEEQLKAQESDFKQKKDVFFQIKQAKWLFTGLTVTLIILAIISLLSSQSKEPTLSDEALRHFEFSSQPLSTDLPNTVVFSYHIPKETNAEAVSIQQYWDETKQIEIAKTGSQASGVYYYPGYFRAKLLINNQIVKEHDLFIKSNGWMATYGIGEPPHYLFANQLQKEGSLHVPSQVKDEVKEAIKNQAYQLSYHLVQPFGGLSSDNFSLNASFRNVLNQGKAVCQTTKVVILGSEGAMIIPFSALGCVGKLNVMMNDVYLKGSENDFSAFGYDLTKWQNFRLEVKNKTASIYMNDQLIREIAYQESAGKVVGLRFRFEGAGELREVKLMNQKKETVYQSDF